MNHVYLIVAVAVALFWLKDRYDLKQEQRARREAAAEEEAEISALEGGEWVCVAAGERDAFPFAQLPWARFERSGDSASFETFVADGIRRGDRVRLRRLRPGERVDVTPGAYTNKVRPVLLSVG